MGVGVWASRGSTVATWRCGARCLFLSREIGGDLLVPRSTYHFGGYSYYRFYLKVIAQYSVGLGATCRGIPKSPRVLRRVGSLI